jgi:hypothetical protein
MLFKKNVNIPGWNEIASLRFFSQKTEVKKWLYRENLSTAGKIAKNNTQGQNRKMLNSSVFVALKLFWQKFRNW